MTGTILKSSHTNADLKKINQFSKTPLTDEQIYTFELILCDNDVDRDHEAFSIDSLNELAKLFIGKTVIKDHSPSADNQVARIYDTSVICQGTEKTSTGEPLYQVKGYAYTVRTDSNKDLILEIDAGIKKEVSVGFSVSDIQCSICSNSLFGCEHIKGQEYNGKTCYGILSGVQDVYECSFVAIPAQRAAGVTKSYKLDTERKNVEQSKEISTLNKDLTALRTENAELKEKAAIYERMREQSIEKAMTNGVRAFGTQFNAEKWENRFKNYTYDEICEQSEEWFKTASIRFNAGKRVSMPEEIGNHQHENMNQYKY